MTNPGCSSAFTGFCPPAMLLKKLGGPPGAAFR